jgi:hypothetical protein
MSVVVPTETFAGARALVGHLRRQTVAGSLELIFVNPDAGSPLEIPPAAVEPFAGLRTVEIPGDRVRDLPAARAEGVRVASAPIVASTETHCFPEPGWAEALIAAHRGEWAAVGPALVNGNPGTAISWSNLLIDYGPWVAPCAAGPMEDLPGHNSSYKRAALSELGPRLEELLAAELVLHAELRRRGSTLYLEPSARTRHFNVTRLGSWLPERFDAGRVFAAARCRRWPLHRRLLYAVGSPLIPIVRLARTLPHARRARPRVSRIRLALTLAVGLAASALGELFGFLAGPGRSKARTARMELHRFDHVRRPERSAG